MKEDIMYTKTHEWGRKSEDGVLEVGLTDYAQSELGDLVFVNLPQEGDEVAAGESIADVESVKAVSDIYSPVSGIICEVNEDLLDQPELINQNAFGTWLFRVKDITDEGEWIDKEAYEAFIKEEE